jgi:hypothetical protein
MRNYGDYFLLAGTFLGVFIILYLQGYIGIRIDLPDGYGLKVADGLMWGLVLNVVIKILTKNSSGS